ncbi:regulatory protein RecX [Kocuria varians]|uniref:regulatory protein RecX n=1 Tax=Kocuria varians TaxID=1272 RepID=UPI0035C50961
MSDSSQYARRRRRGSASRRGSAAPSAHQEASEAVNGPDEGSGEGSGNGPGTGRRGGHGGQDADPREAARAIVLRQLTASAKSRRQLEDKLADRDIPEDVAREVLDRFEEVNLVDDRAFAAMFVRSRAETRRLSRSALRRELSTRGITGEIAEEALEQRSDEDELQDAHELVRKKLPATVDPADRKEHERLTRKLVSMLGRKGYPPGLAFGVVKEELATVTAVTGEDDRPDLDGAEVWDTP